jgi:phosphatidylserine decarboxylase
VTGVPAPDVPPGLHTMNPPIRIRKGDEIGIFHLGSTVVLLLEPGLSVVRPTGPVRFGESLLRPA